MAIDPISISKDIQDDFRRYLRTALNISPAYSEVRRQFSQALEKPDLLFRGPYLQGLPPYEKSDSLDDLISAGVLPGAARVVPFLGNPTRQFYWHQAEAIKKHRSGRNIVLSSGTGSGKTLAFLVPVISEILQHPDPGIHAMLLYPMNALVNDQLKLLRHLLKGCPQVKFGRYVNIEVTPTKEKDGRALHRKALSNEVVSRDRFREDPPHILITNYAMLEYLLLRPDDSPLFHGPWRFIVIDELHTYTGARGSEIAYLMRRLRQRVKGADGGYIQYFGTSATILSSSSTSRSQVASFASTIFDAPVADDDIVVARTTHTPAAGPQIAPPDESLYRSPALRSACDDLSWNDEARNAVVRSGIPQAAMEDALRGVCDFEESLFRIFSCDPRVSQLRTVVEKPVDLFAAAADVFGRTDAASLDSLAGLVRICSLARMPGSDARLVPCRYHMFCRGLDGAYVALSVHQAGSKPELHVMLEPAMVGPDGQSRVLELRSCRKCGQPYLHGYEFVEDGRYVLRPFGSPTEERGNPVWLTWQSPKQASEDETDEVQENPLAGSPIQFCTTCGRFEPEGLPLRCTCSTGTGHVQLWEIQRGEKVAKCFACGGSDSVTTFRTDGEAAQAVVADAFYRHLPVSRNEKALYYPGGGRKLLVFADSRQSAAYFAPYLRNTHESLKLRWLIYHAFISTGESAPNAGFRDLLSYMIHVATDRRLARNPSAQREDYARGIVTEFCLPFSRRQSLEALGLMAVEIALGDFYELPGSLGHWGLSESDWHVVIQNLLATLRLQKVITMPPPLVVEDAAFSPCNRTEIVRASGPDEGRGYRLSAFLPSRGISNQRRSNYLRKVLYASADRAGTDRPSDEQVLDTLHELWKSLKDNEGPADCCPLTTKEVAPGKVGYQIRWEALRFFAPPEWCRCDKCNQWFPGSAFGVCPSLRCDGKLVSDDPNHTLADHHYRRFYLVGSPVPLTAHEHTAQLGPQDATAIQEAFQEGHSREMGQINVLSCSTTFELGVDLGDLEAVFLRGVPPSPANYQQRAGRAGRGVGTAAFVVTFALNRSHDATFFSNPNVLIAGNIRPPRVFLDSETILQRHLNAVILSQYARSARSKGNVFRSAGAFFGKDGDEQTHYAQFARELPVLIDQLRPQLLELIANCTGESGAASYHSSLAERVLSSVNEAKEYYLTELASLTAILGEKRSMRNKLEKEGKPATGISGFIEYLNRRIRDWQDEDWVSFFSDRNVLPRYAFPIYNVSLKTSDAGLKLDRDLKIALSEYAPSAKIVAKGRLWESEAVCLPPNHALPSKWYSRCPKCWHVQRQSNPNEIGAGACPVCGHDGQGRRKSFYIVPKYGFSTDLQTGGKDIIFDRPMKVPASRVLFVPQPEASEGEKITLKGNGCSVDVRGAHGAQFFVFNNGGDGRGLGFLLCNSCGRLLDKNDAPHKTVYGKDCRGKASYKHLGHEFNGTASRLLFTGTERSYEDHGFWLSLMYALLAGMSDALEIERNDVDGVIRPISSEGKTVQEIVLFDDVPGGAGHVRRLLDKNELGEVLQAAHEKASQCTCGADASCYSCLRCYANQYYHDLLQRGPVADYLQKLARDAG